MNLFIEGCGGHIFSVDRAANVGVYVDGIFSSDFLELLDEPLYLLSHVELLGQLIATSWLRIIIWQPEVKFRLVHVVFTHLLSQGPSHLLVYILPSIHKEGAGLQG